MSAPITLACTDRPYQKLPLSLPELRLAIKVLGTGRCREKPFDRQRVHRFLKFVRRRRATL